jgi:hypothetical protein
MVSGVIEPRSRPDFARRGVRETASLSPSATVPLPEKGLAIGSYC